MRGAFISADGTALFRIPALLGHEVAGDYDAGGIQQARGNGCVLPPYISCGTLTPAAPANPIAVCACRYVAYILTVLWQNFLVPDQMLVHGKMLSGCI